MKLFREDKELYVVAKSDGRRQKEIAIRRQKLARLLWTLRGMRREKSRDRLLQRLGAARQKAGRAAAFVRVHLPTANQPATRDTFRFAVDQAKLADAEIYDGHYLLRSNLTQDEPAGVQMLDVELPTTDGRMLTLSRYTQPESGVRLLLQQLKLNLPEHPPPRLSAGQTLELPLSQCSVDLSGPPPGK